MTVFVVFASGRVDSSVIGCLCNSSDVEILGYSTHVEEVRSRIIDNNPQAVIVDLRQADGVMKPLIRNLRSLFPSLILIAVTDTSNADPCSWIEQEVNIFQLPDEEDKFRTFLSLLSDCVSWNSVERSGRLVKNEQHVAYTVDHRSV
ncbi:MAG TPA: hypothetical protein VMH23_00310 [Bacteroidota bacterium]|nr:hypothetical protein [Bacteroidota bacterium]